MTKIQPSKIALLEDALGGDKDLVLFFLTWLKHNRNATRAYKELHPNVNLNVAGVLGARKLRKVKEEGGIELIFDSYGVGIDTYLDKLKEGLEAKKEVEEVVGNYKNGKPKIKKIIIPDYARQDMYHSKLGEILGIGKQTNIAVQVNNNVNNLIQDKKQKYGI